MIPIPVEPRISEFLHRKAIKMKIPLSGTFEITPVCNMDCKMCYVRMSKKEQEAIAPLRSAAEWIELGEQAKKAGMVYLLITGGEPFLRDDFREIMTAFHKMGFIISINSNGTLITDEVIEWLKEVPPVRMNITLYGASNDTYEALCGNPNGYSQATHAILGLKEAGITVKLNCSVTPYNVKDLQDIIKWAKTNKLVIQPTSYMFPPLRKDQTMIGRNERFSPYEASYYRAKIEQYIVGDEQFLERLEDQIQNGPANEPEEDCQDSNCEGIGLQCRAGKSCFWVTWNGTMMPCGMFSCLNWKNCFEEEFSDCWEHVTEESSKIRLPGKCTNCQLKKQCKACGAMVYTETGTFSEVPQYRCDMAHHYQNACFQVRDEILEKKR